MTAINNFLSAASLVVGVVVGCFTGYSVIQTIKIKRLKIKQIEEQMRKHHENQK